MPTGSVCMCRGVRSRNFVCECVWHFTFQCISRLLLWKLIHCSFRLIARRFDLTNEIRTQTGKKKHQKWMEVHFFPLFTYSFFCHFIEFFFPSERRFGVYFIPSLLEHSLLSCAHSYLPKVVNYELMWLNQNWRKFIFDVLIRMKRNVACIRKLPHFSKCFNVKEWELNSVNVTSIGNRMPSENNGIAKCSCSRSSACTPELCWKLLKVFSPVSNTFCHICVATPGNADEILSLNMQAHTHTHTWWKSLWCKRDVNYETTSIPLCAFGVNLNG